jgi:DNA-binding beta-propeller fold protein YncE
VANHGDSGTTGSVTVLDTRACHAPRSGCSATTTIPIPAGAPTSIAVNRATHAVYVGAVRPDGVNTVSMINGASCNARSTSGCGVDPAVMQDGPARGPAIHCGGWYAGVAVNPATNSVYATSTEGCGGIGQEVFVFDGATCGVSDTSGCGQPTATIEAGRNPFDLTVDRATSTIYSALLEDGEDHGRVAVIDGTTCNATTTTGCAQHPATARAGFGSHAVAVDDRTRFVYVVNIEDMSVSVIDGRRCNGTRTSGCHARPHNLPVDDYPDGIATAPSVHTAYVTSGTRGTVSVVPLLQRH